MSEALHRDYTKTSIEALEAYFLVCVPVALLGPLSRTSYLLILAPWLTFCSYQVLNGQEVMVEMNGIVT